jgi:hypothetical protein
VGDWVKWRVELEEVEIGQQQTPFVLNRLPGPLCSTASVLVPFSHVQRICQNTTCVLSMSPGGARTTAVIVYSYRIKVS